MRAGRPGPASKINRTDTAEATHTIHKMGRNPTAVGLLGGSCCRAKDPEQIAMVLRAVLVEEGVGEVPACLLAVLGLEWEGVL
eukprot:8033237-Pyramimonas_sp.AAC.1